MNFTRPKRQPRRRKKTTLRKVCEKLRHLPLRWKFQTKRRRRTIAETGRKVQCANGFAASHPKTTRMIHEGEDQDLHRQRGIRGIDGADRILIRLVGLVLVHQPDPKRNRNPDRILLSRSSDKGALHRLPKCKE